MSETTADNKTMDAESAALTETETSFRAADSKPPRGFSWKKALVFVLLAAGVAWGARLLQFKLTHAETDDAFLTSNVHLVNAHVGGTVSEVLVEPNSEVKKGQVLFRLDPRDHEAKVRQAEAQLAQSTAMLNFTKAEIDQARAKIDAAQAQATKAENDFTRAQELSRTKVVSAQDVDTARATVDSARANLVSAKATAVGMESGLKLAEAALENSRTALENAKLQLSYNTITSPVDGRASKRSVELGAYAQPGQTLIAVVEPYVWIEANFKETQVAKMRAGQRAEITIDAIPGRTFTGYVESFSPASGSTFAMLPPDNATGNFTKVVQRLPVRVRFDEESVKGYEERLRAGLSAVVAVGVAVKGE
jgi:membrane fusion protein (multidrug efflux system)